MLDTPSNSTDQVLQDRFNQEVSVVLDTLQRKVEALTTRCEQLEAEELNTSKRFDTLLHIIAVSCPDDYKCFVAEVRRQRP